jgi:hypothetical protein
MARAYAIYSPFYSFYALFAKVILQASSVSCPATAYNRLQIVAT